MFIPGLDPAVAADSLIEQCCGLKRARRIHDVV